MTMPPISRVSIHNFRGASTPFELEFSPQKKVVLIFGENGTGKTTIVDALDAVGNCSGGSLHTRSSTTLRNHMPTIGKTSAEMVVSLTAGTAVWNASLEVTGLSPCPVRSRAFACYAG